MEWLRPILILAGALFLLLLLWWERRRATRSQAAPALGEAAVRRPQPVIDWGSATAADDVSPPLDARDGAYAGALPQVALQGDEPSGGSAPGPAAAIPAGAREIRVEWPPEGEQQICALRLMPAAGERFAGRSLRLALQAAGFRVGPFGILHLADEDGLAIVSAANLAKPGTLDPARMDTERFPGLNLFTVVSSREPDRMPLERLAAAGRELASRTGGMLLDAASVPLTSVPAWIDRSLSPRADAHDAAGPAA
jgi:hypothetical protein